MSPKKNPHFFPMSRGDMLYLAAVLLFAVVSFLPWSRDVTVGGMALLGWLMAALMVFSPAVALTRIVLERRAAKRQENTP